jgi:methionyl-tRNA synthetase
MGVQYEYHCEECAEAVSPASTRAELAWLKDRVHVVREVAGHVHGGLDTWIVEGLEFLNRHGQHSVVLRRKS